jgi:hypothetical protein
VEDLVVPIPDACRLGRDSFLATCVTFARGSGTAAIFDKPVVQAVLDFKWASFGQRLFTGLAVCSTLLALNVSAYTLAGEDLSLPSKVAWSFMLLLNAAPLLFQEALQAYSAAVAGSLVSSYLASPWNCADIATYLLLITTVALWLHSPGLPATYTISGLTALALWSKLLYYFRGYRATGECEAAGLARLLQVAWLGRLWLVLTGLWWWWQVSWFEP